MSHVQYIGAAIIALTLAGAARPDDKRVPDAKARIDILRTEQSRGAYETAKFYEKRHKWAAARIYYNEVVRLLIAEPNSPLAIQARERIEALNKRIQPEPSK